jgi:hypothetical protein
VAATSAAGAGAVAAAGGGAASGAAAGGGAASGGISGPAATGIGLGIAALAAIAANNTQAHVNGIGTLLPGQSTVPIPGSPQSAAQDGNLALGAGNDRSQGSGQFYLKNPQTGALTWMGTNGSTLMGKLFAKDFAKWTPEQANAYTEFLSTAKSGDPLPSNMSYASAAYRKMSASDIPNRIKTYYGELGGQEGTGMSYQEFLSSAARLGITVTGNVWGG